MKSTVRFVWTAISLIGGGTQLQGGNSGFVVLIQDFFFYFLKV